MFEKLNQQVSAKAKRIEVLEAEVGNLKSQTHRLINEKLALINGTPRETTETNVEKEESDREASRGIPKGKTL